MKCAFNEKIRKQFLIKHISSFLTVSEQHEFQYVSRKIKQAINFSLSYNKAWPIIYNMMNDYCENDNIINVISEYLSKENNDEVILAYARLIKSFQNKEINFFSNNTNNSSILDITLNLKSLSLSVHKNNNYYPFSLNLNSFNDEYLIIFLLLLIKEEVVLSLNNSLINSFIVMKNSNLLKYKNTLTNIKEIKVYVDLDHLANIDNLNLNINSNNKYFLGLQIKLVFNELRKIVIDKMKVSSDRFLVRKNYSNSKNEINDNRKLLINQFISSIYVEDYTYSDYISYKNRNNKNNTEYNEFIDTINKVVDIYLPCWFKIFDISNPNDNITNYKTNDSKNSNNLMINTNITEITYDTNVINSDRMTEILRTVIIKKLVLDIIKIKENHNIDDGDFNHKLEALCFSFLDYCLNSIRDGKNNTSNTFSDIEMIEIKLYDFLIKTDKLKIFYNRMLTIILKHSLKLSLINIKIDSSAFFSINNYTYREFFKIDIIDIINEIITREKIIDRNIRINIECSSIEKGEDNSDMLLNSKYSKYINKIIAYNNKNKRYEEIRKSIDSGYMSNSSIYYDDNTNLTSLYYHTSSENLILNSNTTSNSTDNTNSGNTIVIPKNIILNNFHNTHNLQQLVINDYLISDLNNFDNISKYEIESKKAYETNTNNLIKTVVENLSLLKLFCLSNYKDSVFHLTDFDSFQEKEIMLSINKSNHKFFILIYQICLLDIKILPNIHVYQLLYILLNNNYGKDLKIMTQNFPMLNLIAEKISNKERLFSNYIDKNSSISNTNNIFSNIKDTKYVKDNYSYYRLNSTNNTNNANNMNNNISETHITNTTNTTNTSLYYTNFNHLSDNFNKNLFNKLNYINCFGFNNDNIYNKQLKYAFNNNLRYMTINNAFDIKISNYFDIKNKLFYLSIINKDMPVNKIIEFLIYNKDYFPCLRRLHVKALIKGFKLNVYKELLKALILGYSRIMEIVFDLNTDDSINKEKEELLAYLFTINSSVSVVFNSQIPVDYI